MTDVFLVGIWSGLVFNVAPGAVFAESLRRGVRGGFRPAFGVQVGSLVGDAVWAVLGLTGAAALLTQPRVSGPLTLVGCLVLLGLGLHGMWSALRNVPVATERAEPGRGAARGAVATGVATSVGNVWNVLYWGGAGAAVAGTLGTEAPDGTLAVFFAAFMLASVLWCVVCAGLIAVLRRGLAPRAVQAVECLAAAALVVMAGALAAGAVG